MPSNVLSNLKAKQGGVPPPSPTNSQSPHDLRTASAYDDHLAEDDDEHDSPEGLNRVNNIPGLEYDNELDEDEVDAIPEPEVEFSEGSEIDQEHSRDATMPKEQSKKVNEVANENNNNGDANVNANAIWAARKQDWNYPDAFCFYGNAF